MGTIRIMSMEGDTPLAWDINDNKSVEEAKKVFFDHIKKGYKAFRVNAKGEKGGWGITEFPLFAQEVILVPPFAGG